MNIINNKIERGKKSRTTPSKRTMEEWESRKKQLLKKNGNVQKKIDIYVKNEGKTRRT